MDAHNLNKNEDHAIVLFDGICNFCNSSVQFILQRDPKGYFHFAPLQSNLGREYLERYHIDPKTTDSIVLIEQGKAYVRSTAALRISLHLKGGWPAMSAFLIIPAFIRNGVYDFIAKHRYKWFGTRDSCLLPLPEWRGRFLDM